MTLRDLLLLVRAPLAAGAVSNMLVGAGLAKDPRGWTEGDLLALLAASVGTLGFYWGGMALNDWFDLARDRVHAPRRPLASGRVPERTGLAIGAGLLALGVLAAACAGGIGGGALRGLLAGAAVAACVLGYDGLLKRWRHPGALAMAGCRATNALLGAAVLGEPLGGWVALYAAALLVHVYGLTLVSTWEDGDAPPVELAWAWGATALVPSLLLVVPLLSAGERLGLGAVVGALPLLAVVGTQAGLAIEQGTKARGEAPTRALLRSLWLLDLAVVLGVGPWPLLAPMAALFALATFGAGALFRPPAPTSPVVRHS